MKRRQVGAALSPPPPFFFSLRQPRASQAMGRGGYATARKNSASFFPFPPPFPLFSFFFFFPFLTQELATHGKGQGDQRFSRPSSFPFLSFSPPLLFPNSGRIRTGRTMSSNWALWSASILSLFLFFFFFSAGVNC